MTQKFKIGLLILAVIILFLAQLAMGIDLSKGINLSTTDFFLIKHFRIPSAIAALLGGGLLSLAGLQMQTYFRNPLAGPYVTGVSAGASLGVAFMVLLLNFIPLPFDSAWTTFFFSFVFSFLIFLLVVVIANRLASNVGLLLVGLMITGAVSAFVQLFQLLMTNTSLRDFFMWNQGSFYAITYPQLIILALVTIIVLILSIWLCKPYDQLLLGEDIAQLSGVDLKKTKRWTILAAALSASVVTAFCGPIGFVGLAVPHIARMVLKTNFHFPLSIACFLIGAVVCLVCNLIVLSGVFGLVVPVNILTALFGSPFVIWLLLKKNKEI